MTQAVLAFSYPVLKSTFCFFLFRSRINTHQPVFFRRFLLAISLSFLSMRAICNSADTGTAELYQPPAVLFRSKHVCIIIQNEFFACCLCQPTIGAGARKPASSTRAYSGYRVAHYA
jgi:hypothetical protein